MENYNLNKPEAYNQLQTMSSHAKCESTQQVTIKMELEADIWGDSSDDDTTPQPPSSLQDEPCKCLDSVDVTTGDETFDWIKKENVNIRDEHIAETDSFPVNSVNDYFLKQNVSEVNYTDDQSHSLHTNDVLQSSMCGVVRWDKIKQEIGKKHTNIGKHVCDLCGKGFSSRQHMKTHMNAVHKQLKHTCLVCGEIFSYKMSLNRHIAAAHNNIEIRCIRCGDQFSTRNNLNENLCEQCKKKMCGVGEHICEQCGKDFTSKQSLETHKNAVHKLLKHTCSDCGAQFSEKSNLKKHINSAHKNIRHVCSICNSQFTYRSSLKQHLRNVHKEVKSFSKCPHCEFSCFKAYELQRHISYAHYKDTHIEQEHKCSLCKYSSSRIGNVKAHIARVHHKIRPHKCSQCEFAASMKQNLDNHIARKHNTEEKSKVLKVKLFS